MSEREQDTNIANALEEEEHSESEEQEESEPDDDDKEDDSVYDWMEEEDSVSDLMALRGRRIQHVEEEESESEEDEEEAYNEIVEDLRRAASADSDKLSLELPNVYQGCDFPLTETLIRRVANFLKNELKREVTSLTFRETIAGPLRFDAIQGILSPSRLEYLSLNGEMDNETFENLVRNILGNGFTQLKEFHLWENRIKDCSFVRDLLQNHPQLELLNIGQGNGPLTSDGIRDINTGLSSCLPRVLRHLDIGRLDIGDSGLAAFYDGLSQCKSLQELILQQNNFTKASIPVLTQLEKELPLLTLFQINANYLLFKDAHMEEVKAAARTWVCGQLKELSIQKSGLSGTAMATVIETLSTSSCLETLIIDLEHEETYQSLQVCIDKFRTLRSLQYIGGKRNAWKPELTQAVLKNTSLHEFQCWGGINLPPLARSLTGRHFENNKECHRRIENARRLLKEHATGSVPDGIWPKALSKINRSPPGASATFLILQSQLARWFQDEEVEPAAASIPAESPQEDAERSQKRQRLE